MAMARTDKVLPEYRAVVEELVRRRRSAGVTQADLARALGARQAKISKLENCELRLDVVDFVRICRAIGARPGDLLDQLAADPMLARSEAAAAARPKRPARKKRRSISS
jgi:transcriptional regulator with XRE-family HTH domain